MRIATLIVFTLLGASALAETVVTIEEPVNGSTASGVANLRGWAVSDVGVERIELFINGARYSDIPYGGARGDVRNVFPDFPDSLNSGFGQTLNYGNLGAGEHTIVIRAYDKEGNSEEVSSTFEVVSFPEAFIGGAFAPSITNAETAIDKTSQRIMVSGVTLSDGEVFDLELAWTTPTQSFVIKKITPLNPGGGNGSGGSGDSGGSVDNGDDPDLVSPIVGEDDATLVRETVEIDAPYASYQHACASPAIQAVLPVTLNTDSYADFIIHYWCNATQEQWGQLVTTPTPDALVALVSDGKAGWEVANEAVFGQATLGLGGASRKVVRDDINGDGFDDFAFAMNWEDGRIGDPPDTNAATQAVLMSSSDGTYEVVHLGEPNWGHATGFIRNEDGTTDAAFAGFTDGFHAFRYDGENFSEVEGVYPEQAGTWASGFIDVREGGVSQFIVSSDTVWGDGGVEKTGVVLHEKSLGGGWGAGNGFWFEPDFMVDFITWQESEGAVPVYTIDGIEVLGIAYDQFCVMPPLSGEGNSLLVGKLSGAEYSEPLIEGELYDQDDSINSQKFVFMEIVDGELVLRDTPIYQGVRNVNGNFFDCRDINADGLPDLAFYAFTRPGFDERVEERGKPILYLNDGLGNLIQRDLSAIPGHPRGNELQSQFWDVDGDGLEDLMLFGSAADQGGGDIVIRYLSRPL